MDLTVNERLLLYLRKYVRHRDDYTMPQDITQEGLARSIGVRITHIPRAVNKLEDEGLLLSQTRPITGRVRKRKVYFLTDIGQKQADELKKSLEKKKVIIKDMEGVSKEVLLEEVNKYLPEPVDFYTLYSVVAQKGIFDSVGFYEQQGMGNGDMEESERTSSGLQRPITLGDPEDFLNRSKEIGALHELVTGTEKRIAAVWGQRGMGKTALVHHCLSSFGPDVEVYHIPCQDPNWQKEVVRSLISEFGIGRYLSKKKDTKAGALNMAGLLEIVSHIPALKPKTPEQRAVYFFDDLDEGIEAETGGAFVQLLLRLMERFPALRFIIVSQDKEALEKEFRELRSLTKWIEVKGLDYEFVSEILGPTVDGEEAMGIFHHTKGNPALLEIIREIEREEGGKQMMGPKETALYKYLKSKERFG